MSTSIQKIAAVVVLSVMALPILGCPIQTIRQIRRDMLLDSITFCSSQLLLSAEFTEAWIASVDHENTSISARTESGRVLQGILTNADFRAFLREEEIDLFEFLDRITKCQNDHLERDGYFDLIRPL